MYSLNPLGSMKILTYINESCILKCDNNCIPVDKICNFIIDCKDEEDEKNCGSKYTKIDHEIVCYIENYSRCKDDHLCYPISNRCDGFPDCNDLSDEIDCKCKF